MSIPILQEKLSFGQEAARSLGEGISQGLQANLQQFQEKKKVEQLTQQFEDQGYPAPLARLAAGATVGGKTEIIKNLLEMELRNLPQFGSFPSQEEEIKEKFVVEDEALKGTKPAERVQIGKERYKSHLPLWNEVIKKGQAFEENDIRINELEKLNESNRLPKGVGRFNVKGSGELRAPFFANPEAQRYVKTINDFTVNAKDTFGSRVTNYELNRFMARLPTLMNSEEGRRAILRQMKLFNDINQIYNRNLQNVIEASGGIRNVDWDKAQTKANKISKNEASQLIDEFNSYEKELDSLEDQMKKEEKVDPQRNKKTRLRKGNQIIEIGDELIEKALEEGFVPA